MAKEKLSASKIDRDIKLIEKALLGDTKLTEQLRQQYHTQKIPTSLVDGQSLSLNRQKSGSWIWHYRFRIFGTPHTMSFGSYPETSLAQAREAHREAYQLVKKNINPITDRIEQKSRLKQEHENTFISVAEQWWDNWKQTMSEIHAKKAWARLEKHILTQIGQKSIHSIKLRDISPIIESLKKDAPAVTEKLWISCNQIFRYAVATGIIEHNIFSNVRRADIMGRCQGNINRARVPISELPQLLKNINHYEGVLVRIGLQLITLTFVRHAELREARWDEFNFETKQWIIPAERMKMKTPHIVPLAEQTLMLLKQLKNITGHRKHPFPSTKGENKVMSDGTLNKALNIMGYKGRQTVHGFRGLASTILHEKGHDHAHIELQLAHMPRNKISAAYNHATYIPQRTKMMQDWANLISEYQDQI